MAVFWHLRASGALSGYGGQRLARLPSFEGNRWWLASVRLEGTSMSLKKTCNLLSLFLISCLAVKLD
jgi:hypothetical protein